MSSGSSSSAAPNPAGPLHQQPYDDSDGTQSTMPPHNADHLLSMLSELGPACTATLSTFRDTMREVHPSSLPPVVTARLLLFGVVATKDGDLSGVITSTLLNEESRNIEPPVDPNWDGMVMANYLAEEYPKGVREGYSHDEYWRAVVQGWDMPNLPLSPAHIAGLLQLYHASAGFHPPLAPLVSHWKHPSSQLRLLELLTESPYRFELTEEEELDSQVLPNPPRCWASSTFLSRLLTLSDVEALNSRVNALFVLGLKACADVILCSVVRLQLSSQLQSSPPGKQKMKEDLMRELIPYFFHINASRDPPWERGVHGHPRAIARMWDISSSTVVALSAEAWRSASSMEGNGARVAATYHVLGLIRCLPQTEGVRTAFLEKDVEFAISLGLLGSDVAELARVGWGISSWLRSRVTKGASNPVMFIVYLVAYIGKSFAACVPRMQMGDASACGFGLETLASVLEMLQDLEEGVGSSQIPSLPLPGSTSEQQQQTSGGMTIAASVRALTEACLAKHPQLRELSKILAPFNQTTTSEDIEEAANSYFQKIYTSEQSIGEVVEMLKRFKVSGNQRENDIFACMIHNLFDEYRFFAKYPEKELRITGILFGMLIQHQLVSSITLGIALRYVLEALRKPPNSPPTTPSTTSNSGKMFRFGMFALEQFKGRLDEWPQYCSHIVQIPHLREGYAELVAEIDVAMSNSAAAAAAAAPEPGRVTPIMPPPAVNNVSKLGHTPLPAAPPIPPPPRRAVFGPGLGRAVHDLPKDEALSIEQAVLDHVQFVFNNLSPSNVEAKTMELQSKLGKEHFAWLGQYLVAKRISTQPNFHGLYLTFLDYLMSNGGKGGKDAVSKNEPNDYGRGLVDAILESVYSNVGTLLRSHKITTSTSERSLLKNLGSWLGQITLARNRPILQIMLDCKELLYQGYETGMLIAVTPFVAKILEGAKNSSVFRPPNPWLMGLLGVFRSLYEVEDLKMNIKFEVEVLCKNLGVRLEDVTSRKEDLAKRIPPIKERNPDFNLKSSMAGANSQQQPQQQQQPPPVNVNVANSLPPSATSSLQGNLSNANSPAMGALTPPDRTPNLNLEQQPSSTTATPAIPMIPRSFGDLSLQPGAQPLPSPTFGDGTGPATVIPNLGVYITINPSLTQLLKQHAANSPSTFLTPATLKRTVPVAVDRAIREIIQPVVDRSMTIACITTKEIVTKDYAMEGDENRMRKAAQLMVANLAGSLALVTCREPLKASVSTHLRTLLLEQDKKDETNNLALIEQCVSICASDNLELGCMLIEKAATEKAVRDMEEGLTPAIAARRRHREMDASNSTNTPFYDAAALGAGKYPAALPEPLRPRPGMGLRSEQLLVYEAFQRLPRAAAAAAAAPKPPVREKGLTVTYEALDALSQKLEGCVSTLLTAAGPARSAEITLQHLPETHEIRVLLGQAKKQLEKAYGTPGLPTENVDLVLRFAQQVFKRLYERSLAQPLALEVFVTLLECLNAVAPQLGGEEEGVGAVWTWSTYAPTETEPQRKLHRTILLLLARSKLIKLRDVDGMLARLVDRDVVSAEKEEDVSVTSCAWIEFALLFVQTAVVERIASPPDLPRVLESLTKIAGNSGAPSLQNYRKPILRLMEELQQQAQQLAQQAQQATQQAQLAQQQQQQNTQPTQQAIGPAPETNKIPPPTSAPIAFSSSIGAATLSNLSDATRRAAEQTEATIRNDPLGMRQQVTFLLEGWMRVNSEAPGSEKALAQYMQLLQQHGVGKLEDQTERFFRHSTELAVEAVLKTATRPEVTEGENANPEASPPQNTLNYNVIDVYAKLVALLVRYMNSGGTQEQVAAQRISLLNKVLGITMRTLMAHYERNKSGANLPTTPAEGGVNVTTEPRGNWDQRPWYRLLLNLVHDLNSPSPALDPISLGILSVFGSAFHVVQPLVVPGFAFAWMELVSHRMFFSNLLLAKNQRGWGVAHQLIIDLFLFLEPHLRRTELTDAIKHLYKGTLRVLLVLLHDFPSFLAGYSLSFCNVIPENCVQLRNLILSALPQQLMALPDPFTPNLKIDLLPEISQNPVILSDVTGPLGNIREDLDGYLKSRQPSNFVGEMLLPRLYKEGAKPGSLGDVDAPRVNSLVLYVGTQAISRLQNSVIAHTPEMEVLQKLMELDDRGRYISLNAIANQLRYPSSHTHYYSCVMLFLFGEAKAEGVKEQITRVLLERLIVHRPHPWGLLITFLELIKNQRYQFWSHPFTRCATEIEKVFESVARSCVVPDGGALRSAGTAGGDERAQ